MFYLVIPLSVILTIYHLCYFHTSGIFPHLEKEKVSFLSDTVSVRSLKLCVAITLLEIYIDIDIYIGTCLWMCVFHDFELLRHYVQFNFWLCFNIWGWRTTPVCFKQQVAGFRICLDVIVFLCIVVCILQVAGFRLRLCLAVIVFLCIVVYICEAAIESSIFQFSMWVWGYALLADSILCLP